MIALNVVLMAAVIVLIAAALAWAIVSDRRSKRTSGGGVAPSDAPLGRNLMMPRHLRSQRMHRWPTRRGRGSGSAV